MAEGFRLGDDLHTVSAAGVLGLNINAVTEEQRQIGKTFNFSIVYGGGMPTLMRQLGVTAPEALSLLRNYHGTWPGLGWATKRKPANPGTLLHAIAGRIEDRGYVTTLYGRHLHPKAMHAALNNLCQGCAADLAKWAMIRVHQGLKAGGFRSHIVNFVHDELMLDCARDEVPALAVLLPEWMTDPRIEAVVPIKPSCEISWTTWAEKEKYVG
jgi:DNA polymerase-1